MKLIEIKEDKYDVNIELLYAKSNNFTGNKIYLKSKCYLHKDALPKLLSAIFLAKALGYKFKIYDTFRPKEAQEILWKKGEFT